MCHAKIDAESSFISFFQNAANLVSKMKLIYKYSSILFVVEIDIYSSVSLIQRIKPRMVIDTRSLVKVVGSKATLARALRLLESHGFIRGRTKGWVAFIDALWQPTYVIESILPSLKAFKRVAPIKCSRRVFRIWRYLSATLDWKAWELTGYQTPRTLYIYADSIEEVMRTLRATDQTKPSNTGEELVYILPKVGEFHNPVERTYLDCIAQGGRSWLDAVAIELLYPHMLSVKASFPVDLVSKVLEDLNMGVRKSGESRLKRAQIDGSGSN